MYHENLCISLGDVCQNVCLTLPNYNGSFAKIPLPPFDQNAPQWEQWYFGKEEVENDNDIALAIFFVIVGFLDFLCSALSLPFSWHISTKMSHDDCMLFHFFQIHGHESRVLFLKNGYPWGLDAGVRGCWVSKPASWPFFFKNVIMRGVYKIQKPTTKIFAPTISKSISTFVHQNHTTLMGGGGYQGEGAFWWNQGVGKSLNFNWNPG